jgi:hypothetical protein
MSSMQLQFFPFFLVLFLLFCPSMTIDQDQIVRYVHYSTNGTIGYNGKERTKFLFNPNSILLGIADIYSIQTNVTCVSHNATLPANKNNCVLKYLSEDEFDTIATSVNRYDDLENVSALYDTGEFGAASTLGIPLFTAPNVSSFSSVYREFYIVLYLQNDYTSNFTYGLSIEMEGGQFIDDVPRNTLLTILATVLISVLVPVGVCVLFTLCVCCICCCYWRRKKNKKVDPKPIDV